MFYEVWWLKINLSVMYRARVSRLCIHTLHTKYQLIILCENYNTPLWTGVTTILANMSNSQFTSICFLYMRVDHTGLARLCAITRALLKLDPRHFRALHALQTRASIRSTIQPAVSTPSQYIIPLVTLKRNNAAILYCGEELETRD